MTRPGRVVSWPSRPAVNWALLVLAVVVHLTILYAPDPPGPAGPPGLDKVVHVLIFAAVAWTGRRVGLSAVLLGVVLVGHALLSEVLQATLLGERSGDPFDVVADLVGVALGLVLPIRARRVRT